MVKSRKDNNGKILLKGESQRKDGIYQFRYTDRSGNRITEYAGTLKELRLKEDKIQQSIYNGIDYAAGRITVAMLVQRCLSLNQGLSPQTRANYEYMLKPHLKSWLFRMKTVEVKVSDVKAWCIELQEKYSYSTINHLKCILNQAFQMAFEEQVITQNPCNFKLSKVVRNLTKPKASLMSRQQQSLMAFIKGDKTYAKYYDQYVILLGTGLRVSELCGLTRRDLDFEQRRIRVDHQLLQIPKQGYRIEKPKTEKGMRYVPMSDEVYFSLQNVLANRPQAKQEVIIDGYSDFLFLTREGKPESKNSIERRTRRILAKYNSQNQELLPHITPHIFRHTFCSNMANSGLEPNVLKYIMGHSKISTTYDIYAHAEYEAAAQRFADVVELRILKVAQS